MSGIPSVMKAAQQTGYGDVRNILTLRDDAPVPRELSSTQVLVRVHAASINPIDWKLLDGSLSLVARLSFPHIPGKDVAGVVVDVGSGVKRFRVGDKVYGNFGMSDGSFAEYARADESLLAIKPQNLSMEEAAAVPLTCETSYEALFTKLSPPVGAGSKILICGGSTAAGLYAIQLAKAVGAQVSTTCSKRNFGLLEKLGYPTSETNSDADQLHLIDYNEKDFGKELKGQDYDVVYDCVGGPEQWTSAQEILKRNGQFITIVGDHMKSAITFKAAVSTVSNLINRKFWSVFGSAHHSYILHSLSQRYENLDELRTKYLENGKVKPIIDTVFDWRKDGVESLYALYEKSKSGKAQGKLVLKIADEE
ncbi:unnamed protein product [Adineta ricciae]|uniref:Enoyl reductase (ER) domain-containing protein n=1 Tax=Adineta ricciae TaxID=249248 RepID=A0A814Z6Q7_ADIRI|nr:unnamed protein product [Adineta ricciae]